MTLFNDPQSFWEDACSHKINKKNRDRRSGHKPQALRGKSLISFQWYVDVEFYTPGLCKFVKREHARSLRRKSHKDSLARVIQHHWDMQDDEFDDWLSEEDWYDDSPMERMEEEPFMWEDSDWDKNPFNTYEDYDMSTERYSFEKGYHRDEEESTAPFKRKRTLPIHNSLGDLTLIEEIETTSAGIREVHDREAATLEQVLTHLDRYFPGSLD